jgi:putative transposase
VKQIITAKLKLETTPDQFTQLRQTQLAYRDALNYVSHYAFDCGKTSSFQRLQREMYREIRGRFALPSEMTNNVLKQVAATYKSLWTKAKRNAEHRRKKWTKRRFKGLDEPPKYTSPTVTYDYGYDYTFKKEQRVSIRALQKRVALLYTGYEKHLALIRSGAKIGTGKLWYDGSHQQFYLLVSLELELTDPTPETQQDILGVDVVSPAAQECGQSWTKVCAPPWISPACQRSFRIPAGYLTRYVRESIRTGTCPLWTSASPTTLRVCSLADGPGIRSTGCPSRMLLPSSL